MTLYLFASRVENINDIYNSNTHTKQTLTKRQSGKTIAINEVNGLVRGCNEMTLPRSF